MKYYHLLIILFFNYQLHSQCESTSKVLWDMIKKSNYDKIDSLLLPIEQKIKIMHWPKDEKSENILRKIQDSLKISIIRSAEDLRSNLMEENFKFTNSYISKCQIDNESELIVFISDSIKELSFTIETLTTDKTYLALPIYIKSRKQKPIIVYPQKKNNTITCTDNNCQGTYQGKEFINGSDVAHQFSNTMSAKVGDQLKALYKAGKYSKVDFSKIEMTTKGMGSGTVTYYLKIPFVRVAKKCDAYTSFDHVGGWNHTPALSQRKEQLKGALMNGQKLDISDLKTTKEGLQEYWIQWKNKITQAECE
tara:strand:+ start:1403 stop:2323 length:921 start_codon:yes stop_codon:yes gene_type:complete